MELVKELLGALLIFQVLSSGLASDSVDLGKSPTQFVVDGNTFCQTKKAPDLSKDPSPPPAIYDGVMIEEGDIMVLGTPEDEKTPLINMRTRVRRKVEGDRWPGNVIPWMVNPSLPAYSASSLSKIRTAMSWWEKHTCIRFVPASSRPHNKALIINNELTCASYIGYKAKLPGRTQALRLLESTCLNSVGTPAHELGHALGLIHEHTRIDRDEYIDINPNVISSSSIHNFDKAHESTVPPGVAYDVGSIMHYKPLSFSVNGQEAAILSRDLKKQNLMGQREALGFYDIKAVNIHYQCQGRCNNRCQNEGYPHLSNGRCICVCPEGLTGASCERVESSCGSVINLRAGGSAKVESPNYPRPSHSSHTKCWWLIKAPPGYYIEMQFSDMDVAQTGVSLSAGVRCIHQLEIRSNLLGQRGDMYCGRGKVGPFNTELGQVKDKMMVGLDLSSRNGVRGRGFSATVTAYQDACLSNPCFHGSTCESGRSSRFICRCRQGYTGHLCDVLTDGAIDCDFSESMCGLTNAHNDQLDFHREFRVYKYKELLERTASGNKYFLATAVQYKMNPRSESKLLTPTFSASARSVRCLSFYSKISGSWQQGTLTVRLLNAQTSAPIKTVSTLTKKNGEGWKLTRIQLSEKVDYKVEFSFRTSNALFYNSLMGLDDISILPQRCWSSPCSSSPCNGEGSICVETEANSFKCICPPGRTGAFCNSYNTNGFLCTFDSNDICGWTQDRSDQFDWVRTHGASDARRRTGPTSSAVGSGYYMVADTSSSTAYIGAEARVISPSLLYTGNLCVGFYYHMHGEKVGSLKLQLRYNGRVQSRTYFQKTGSQSTDWIYTEVDVLVTVYNTQMVFGATVGNRHLADIAIDDVKMRRGRCRPQPTTRTPTSVRTLPSLLDRVILPQRVSTTRQTSKSTPSSTPMRTATPRPVSKRVPAPTRTVSNPAPTRTTAPRPTSTRSSTPKRTPTPRPAPTRAPQPSRTTAVSTTGAGDALIDCGFEKDLQCSRQMGFTDRARILQRQSGSTPTWNTGPSQAADGNYYLYLEADFPATRGAKAEIQTKALPYSGKACVSFAYHMTGTGVGRLDILRNRGGYKQRLWSKAGSQHNIWHRASLDTDLFWLDTVIFAFERGSSISSDIAVDSIKITKGRCSERHNSQTFQGVICDFEEDMCGFTADSDDRIEWELNSGPTPSPDTGPDAAQSGEKYIYIESSFPTPPGATARIISPSIPAQVSQVCVDFSYHLRGSNIGQLKVYIKPSGSSSQSGGHIFILNRSESEGRQWNKKRTNIEWNSVTPYQVVFEGTTATTDRYWSGDMAIDNIKITPGKC